MALIFSNGQTIGGYNPDDQLTATGYGTSVGVKSKKAKMKTLGETTGTGIVGDIAQGFLQPVANIGADFLENLNKSNSADQANYNPIYQSQSEYEDYQKNPLLRRVQDIAGVGANFIPGSGVASAAAQGAAQGFSAARGVNDEGKADIGNVVGGTLLGAGAGAGLAKVGQMAGNYLAKGGKQAAEKAVENVAERAIYNAEKPAMETASELAAILKPEEIAPATTAGGKIKQYLAEKGGRGVAKLEGITGGDRGVDYVKNLDTSRNVLKKAAEFFGIKFDSSNLPKLFDKTSPLRTQLLEEADQLPQHIFKDTANGVEDFLSNELINNKPIEAAFNSDEAKNIITNRLSKIIPNFDEASLANGTLQLKPSEMEAIKEAATGGYLKAAGYAKGKVSAGDLADAEIYKLFSGKLNDIEGFRPINQVREQLIINSEGLKRNFLTGQGNIKSASELKNPLSMAVNAIGKPLYKGMEAIGTGNLPSLPGIPAPIVNGGANILNKIGTNPLVQRGVAGALANTPAEIPQSEPTQSIQQSGNPVASPLPATEYDDILSLMRQGVDLKTAQGILGQVGGGQAASTKPLSAEQRKLQSNVRSGLRALDDVEGILGSDQNALLSGNLPGFAQSSNARKLNTAISQVTDVIGRLRSGGAINKQEEERFRSFLPSWTDDADTKAYKIQSLRSILQDAMTMQDLSQTSLDNA